MGMEWMRGFAAFGVICMHSGMAVHNNTTAAARLVPPLFDFAVPFFLAMAFFFAIRQEEAGRVPWRQWLRGRASRLLLPFAFWSVIYCVAEIVKLTLHHQTGEILPLLEDPVGLILEGGHSVALYFLPLLLIGLILVHLLSRVLTWQEPPWIYAIAMISGIAVEHACDALSKWAESTAISPTATHFVTLMDRVSHCVPLIFGAALLATCLRSPIGRRRMVWFAAAAGLVLLVGCQFVSISMFEPSFGGLCALLFAWGLSGLLPANGLALIVGRYSFGVYLVHQAYLELIQMSWVPHHPAGVATILLITAGVYVASMMTVALAERAGEWPRFEFGLK